MKTNISAFVNRILNKKEAPTPEQIYQMRLQAAKEDLEKAYEVADNSDSDKEIDGAAYCILAAKYRLDLLINEKRKDVGA